MVRFYSKRESLENEFVRAELAVTVSPTLFLMLSKKIKY
jgi:hypothetical protein